LANLSWYIGRLRSMSLPEIAHRFSERRVISAMKKDWGDWGVYGSGAVPVFDSSVASPRVSAGLYSKIVEFLGTLENQGYRALGVEWTGINVYPIIDSSIWTYDPVSGDHWTGSDVFSFDISYRHEQNLGDIKYTWEINRLQFLQPVAAAYSVDRDKKKLSYIEFVISDWHSKNPPLSGIGWNSGIEVALRALTLVVVADFCWIDLSVEVRSKIFQIFSASANFLRKLPSLYSSANNHRIAELAALVVIEGCLSGKITGQIDRDFDCLCDEFLLQVMPDGGGSEQSPTYAAFTVEFTILSCYWARRFGMRERPEIQGRIQSWLRLNEWWVSKDGIFPSIGDDDEGCVLLSLDPPKNYVNSVCSAAAGFFGISYHGPVADIELRHSLFGQAAGAYDRRFGAETFPDVGYTVFNSRAGLANVSLVVDHGYLGYLSIAAHGHADALSIVLSIDDLPVLVDPGTFLYHSGRDVRDWFRGTRSHNTLNLSGVNQSEILGPFNWGKRAVARIEDLISTEGAEGFFELALTASHDGYFKNFGAIHRRSIKFSSSELVIHDSLSIESGLAEICWQFSEICSIERDGPSADVMVAGRVVARIFLPTDDFSMEIGDQFPQGGWISTSFGRKVAAPCLRWRGTVGPLGVRTILKIS